MNLFLVDDHTLLLDGLENLILKTGEYNLVGKAGSVGEALEKLAKAEVHLLITDYQLPDGDGLGLIRKMKKIQPGLQFLMLSMHDEVHLVQEVLQEGVSGYLLKKDSKSELLKALEAIEQGQVYLSPDINRMLIQNLGRPEPQQLLTEREREVLTLIADECSNKQIAEKLFISERTVETHRKNIFRKTQTGSIVGLIKFAYANNLI